MQPNTFVLRDDHIRNNALAVIKSIPLEPTPEVVVRDHHGNRTVAQNSLMWLWITIIAGERGETKNKIHFECKRDLLVPIYERDDPEYAAMIQAIREVYRDGMADQARFLHEQVVKLTSTTRASVKQFTEYLEDIEKDSFEKRISLPHPEDGYYLAMGIKR